MIKIAFVVCCAAFAAAEAEADAGLGYAGLGYGAGLGYTGLGYGYGLAAPVATGYGVSNVANTVGIAGVVHVAKREADAEPKAEADAGLLYEAYGYGAGLGYAGLGYGYSGLGYAGYGGYGLGYGLGYAGYGGYGLGYGRLGYAGLGYYGKRSADAEPKADPYLLYGGYAGHYGY